MQQRISLGLIDPNPFRNMKRNPIRDDKVEALKSSINDTDFWGNVVVRPSPSKPGRFELAHGHHRLWTLFSLGRNDALFIVLDWNDEQMLLSMAAENNEEWGQAVEVRIETVRAARDYLATAGVSAKLGRDVTGSESEVQELLGWPHGRVQQAWTFLKDDHEPYNGLSLEQATVLRHAINRHLPAHLDLTKASIAQAKELVMDRVKPQLVGGVIGKRGIEAEVRATLEENGLWFDSSSSKPKTLVPAALVRGIANSIDSVGKSLRDLNDLLIEHPEAAPLVRAVTGAVGQREYLLTCIVKVQPELDRLHAVLTVPRQRPLTPAS